MIIIIIISLLSNQVIYDHLIIAYLISNPQFNIWNI